MRTLARDISPPALNNRARGKKRSSNTFEGDFVDIKPGKNPTQDIEPTLAAIEAGQAQMEKHLEYFTQHFKKVARPVNPKSTRLAIDDFQDLYKCNDNACGRHFVIHQHDHPISGVHYDLRLQISGTSTLSWSVPYGLPGNPNSVRPNRMAVETRVHTLWNNLIESASHATGSLLIWDTGEYEVLPRRKRKPKPQVTDEEDSNPSELVDAVSSTGSVDEHNQRLTMSFQSRYIKLRLHGTRLPENYTLSLRLPSANDRTSQPHRPKRKRRRLDPNKAAVVATKHVTTDSEPEAGTDQLIPSIDDPDEVVKYDTGAAGKEDEEIRRNNAYIGAHNTVGSVHQRQWFLTLDRSASGFSRAKTGSDGGRWKGSWEPFCVYGRDIERSIVTGRSADEVMADEGVERFVGRKMWRPITE